MDKDDRLFKEDMIKLFKNVYEVLVKKEKFTDFYETLDNDLANLKDTGKREVIYKNLTNSIKRTKTRWLNKYVNGSNNSLSEDIEYAEHFYKRVLEGVYEPDKFVMIYGVNNIDEYKKKMFNELYTWRDNEDALLSSYKYIGTFQKRSITLAFRSDILKLYYDFLTNNAKSVITIPSVLINFSIDTTNKKDYLKDDEKEFLDDNLSLEGTIDRLIVNKENQQKLLMKLEKQVYLRIEEGKDSLDIITQIALLKAIKQLNSLDTRIISHYYTHFYNIVADKSVDKYIGDLVSELGLSDSKKNTDAVIKSLLKIGSIRLESENYEGREIKGTLFEVSISERDGRKFAQVFLGGFLRTLIIMDSSFNFNKDVFDLLSNDAQQIAIWLQNRRLKMVLESEDFKDVIAIQRFTDAILMSTKSIYKKRDRIINALDELKQYKLIVKNYEYIKKNYEFVISYIELPESVIKKIKNKEFKTGELIEGQIHADYTVE